MSEQELRAMVREVLKEALAQHKPGASAPSPSAAEPVRIENDADLAAFVARLAALMGDPGKAAAVRSGRHRFTLAQGGTPASPATPAPASAATTTLSGTVTEKAVTKLPKGATVRLAPGAVMTPLARDRARAMGIRIERRR